MFIKYIYKKIEIFIEYNYYINNKYIYQMNSCTDCFINFCSEFSLEDLAQSLEEDKKIKLLETLKKYNTRDSQFLYFITLTYISLFTASLFAFDKLDLCESKQNTILNLVVFSGSYSLFVAAFRVYFFKLYLQFPVIALFEQYKPECPDIFMNIVFTFGTLGLIALFVAMFYEAKSGSSTNGIILMCVLFGCCIGSTWWYKKIVHRHIQRASKNSNIPEAVVVSRGPNPTNRLLSQISSPSAPTSINSNV